MLQQLGWKSLEHRRKILRLVMMYKLLKGHITNDGLPTLVSMQRRSRHTNTLALKTPPSRTNYHLFSYFPRTIREWNTIPEDIVQKTA